MTDRKAIARRSEGKEEWGRERRKSIIEGGFSTDLHFLNWDISTHTFDEWNSVRIELHTIHSCRWTCVTNARYAAAAYKINQILTPRKYTAHPAHNSLRNVCGFTQNDMLSQDSFILYSFLSVHEERTRGSFEKQINIMKKCERYEDCQQLVASVGLWVFWFCFYCLGTAPILIIPRWDVRTEGDKGRRRVSRQTSDNSTVSQSHFDGVQLVIEGNGKSLETKFNCSSPKISPRRHESLSIQRATFPTTHPLEDWRTGHRLTGCWLHRS